MPKTIYLDSSDFSDLSAPKERQRPEDAEILTALRKARDDRTAIFLISPPLLSEAVHASASNKEDATRRARLMSELCVTNTLRYPTDISRMELTRALSGKPIKALTLEDILSRDDEWFGRPSDPSHLARKRKEVRSTLRRELKARLALAPREQRRAAKAMLDFSKRSSRLFWRQQLNEVDFDSASLDLPIHLIEKSTFIDWFVGEKTDAEMHSHMTKVLTDPFNLFQYVIEAMDQRKELYGLARMGGLNLSNNVEKLSRQVLKFAQISSELGRNVDSRSLVQELVSSSIVRDFVGAFSEQSVEHLNDEEVMETVNRSPSMATLVHVLREYFHALVQSNMMKFKSGNHTPTIPKASDYGDLMHVFYAPYVDIFRCDARFGSHLKSHSLMRNKVAARRRDILQML